MHVEGQNLRGDNGAEDGVESAVVSDFGNARSELAVDLSERAAEVKGPTVGVGYQAPDTVIDRWGKVFDELPRVNVVREEVVAFHDWAVALDLDLREVTSDDDAVLELDAAVDDAVENDRRVAAGSLGRDAGVYDGRACGCWVVGHNQCTSENAEGC